MSTNYEFSMVIPCKNEIKSLPILIEQYREVKGKIHFQLVIVNNESNDGTKEYLQVEIKKPKNNFIKVINVVNSRGYGDGLQQGLNNCDAEIIGWSHGDLQCPPEDVFKGYDLYKHYNNPKVFVKGRRVGRDWKSLFRSYWLDVYAMIFLFRIYNDINAQPKIFHRNLLKSFRNPPFEFSYDLYVQDKALKLDYKIKSFKVVLKNREFGFSKWTYSTFTKINTIKGYIHDIFDIRVGIIK